MPDKSTNHKAVLMVLYVLVAAVITGLLFVDSQRPVDQSAPVEPPPVTNTPPKKPPKAAAPKNNEVETHSQVEEADPNKQGIALANQGRLAEALPYFREAIDRQPDRPDLWSNLGVTYMRLGIEEHERHGKEEGSFTKLKDAIEAYDAALAIDGANQMARENLQICQNFVKDKFKDRCTYELCGAGFAKSASGKRDETAMGLFKKGRVKEAVETLCTSRSELTFKVPKSGADVSSKEFKKMQTVFKICGVLIIENAVEQVLVDKLRAAQEKQFSEFISRIAENPSAVNTTNTEQRSPGRYEIKMPLELPFTDPGLIANSRILPFAKSFLGERIEIDTFSHVTSQPYTPVQHFHRDVGSLHPSIMGSKNFLPPQGVVVFIPLIKVKKRMGPTEFVLGSHVNLKESEVNQLPLMEMPAKAGSAIMFDIRIQHRGGSNQTPNNRPMIYLSYVKEWYFDRVNFNDKQTKKLDSHSTKVKKLLSRLDTREYTQLLEDILEKDYGVDVKALQSSYDYTKHDLTAK